jgi:hypothetical protein
MKTQIQGPLLSQKELCLAIKRSPRFVKYMRATGFRMIAGRTTLKAALDWLKTNPHPCRRVQ